MTPSNKLQSEIRPIKTTITNLEIKDDRVVLQPDGNSVRFCFTTFNHCFSHKVRYAYRLKGLEDEWLLTSPGTNYAIYNHLPEGDFVFEVKATDENGVWSRELTRLDVVRLPAFYETCFRR